MSTIPTVAPKGLPAGGKIALSNAIGPVMVTRARVVGKDKQTIEFQLEQMFEAPINGQAGVLAITMGGHSAFNTGPRKRIAWQNFYTENAIKWGLVPSWDYVANGRIETEKGTIEGAVLLNMELKIPNTSGPGFLQCKLIEVDTFEARKPWMAMVNGKLTEQHQQPKKAGADGDVLTYDGKNIYRNTGLSFPGAGDGLTGREWDHDLIINHNNVIMSSTVRNALKASGIAQPQMPSSRQPNPALPGQQNAPIGETSNLVQGAPEPTRHTPDENSPEVAQTTLAEDQREAGERPIVQ